MAGSDETYDHTPYFWSDAFELGWEAIGRLDARLDTEVVELGEGRDVVYYLDEQSRIRKLIALQGTLTRCAITST